MASHESQTETDYNEDEKCPTIVDETSSDSSSTTNLRSSYFDNVPVPVLPRKSSDVCLVDHDEFMKYLMPSDPDDFPIDSVPELELALEDPSCDQAAKSTIPSLSQFPVSQSTPELAQARILSSNFRRQSDGNFPTKSEYFVSAMKRNRMVQTTGTQTGLDSQDEGSPETQNDQHRPKRKEKFLPYRPPGETRVLQVLSSTEDESETSSVLHKVRHVSGKDAEELDAPVTTLQPSVIPVFQNVQTVQRQDFGGVADEPRNLPLQSHSKSSSASFSETEITKASEASFQSNRHREQTINNRSLGPNNVQSQFSSLLVEYDGDAYLSSPSDSSSSTSKFSLIRSLKTAPQPNAPSSESIFSFTQSAKLGKSANKELDKQVTRSNSEVNRRNDVERDWQKLTKFDESKLETTKELTDNSSSRELTTELTPMFQNCTLTESTYATSTTFSGVSSSTLPSTLAKPDLSASGNDAQSFLLLEHQRKVYIKRLKKEIRWLEKIQGLLKGNEEKMTPKKATLEMYEHKKNARRKKHVASTLREATDEFRKSSTGTSKSTESVASHSTQVLVKKSSTNRSSDTNQSKSAIKNRKLDCNSSYNHQMSNSAGSINGSDDNADCNYVRQNTNHSVNNSFQNLLVFDNENFRFVPIDQYSQRNKVTKSKHDSRGSDYDGEKVIKSTVASQHVAKIERTGDTPIAVGRCTRIVMGDEHVSSRSVQTSPIHTTVDEIADRDEYERYFISLPVTKETVWQSYAQQKSRVGSSSRIQRQREVRSQVAQTERREITESQKSRTATCVAWSVNHRTTPVSSQKRPRNTSNVLTLQEALSRFRGNFIERSSARTQQLKTLARARQYAVFKQFLVTQHRIFEPQRERPSSANAVPINRNRVFTDHEMKLQTKKLYRGLPEIVSAATDKHRKALYETNRLKAQIFKNRVLERTLKGQVSFSLTKSIL